ncbi:MAG: thymidine phosphorylase [Burkholderiales bacterium]|nr:MAG: thymidine phosphorylase [Burkholderiales bacterium]
MRAVDIIIKKRDGLVLSRAEIEFFVQGYAAGRIPDYQASAWAMAVLLKGMDEQETTDLTLAIAGSGEVLDLSGVVDLAVDKHSTGGVGDKTTLVVEPVVAACGLPVGKMSGRGLGFSGGTLDKMESIPGFRTNLSTDEFLDHLRRIGVVLTGQTADLAPADGKLYALRDVTGTVPSMPLIASSVMSKKIAGGAQAILLDVKIGLGAFMDTVAEGRLLAERMVAIGRLSDRCVIALLSDMNQPLGIAVGNALEVKEAIDTLHGGGPADFHEHCLEVAARLLLLGKTAVSLEDGRRQALAVLEDGRAWDKFRTLVAAQAGDVAYIDDPSRLPSAPIVEEVPAQRSGWLAQVHARIIGETAVELGAGRASKEDPIDHGVGILVHHKVGELVEAGQTLFTIYARSQPEASSARLRLEQSLAWSTEPVPPLPLFYGIVE